MADMGILSDDPYEIPGEDMGKLKVEKLILAGKAYQSAKGAVIPGVIRGLTNGSRAY